MTNSEWANIRKLYVSTMAKIDARRRNGDYSFTDDEWLIIEMYENASEAESHAAVEEIEKLEATVAAYKTAIAEAPTVMMTQHQINNAATVTYYITDRVKELTK